MPNKERAIFLKKCACIPANANNNNNNSQKKRKEEMLGDADAACGMRVLTQQPTA
jgi:hypothetical protein